MVFVAGEDPTAQRLNFELTALMSGLLTAEGSINEVLVGETTASTTYTDLGTVGPTVTITSQGTRAVVFMQCQMWNMVSPAGSTAMTFAVSGATSIAANDVRAVAASHDGTGFGFYGGGFAVISINPGTNTYTAKYRVMSGSGGFDRRRMFVLAP